MTPPPKADIHRVDPFFPKQVMKDLGASVAVLALVLLAAIREHGAPLDAPADPASDYPARPEWYFLALFQLLKYFHGPLELVGTVGLPALVAGYLFALPLLDRKDSTALRGRIRPLVPLLALGIGVVALTVQASRQDAGDPAFQKERAKADMRAHAAARLAMDGVPPEGPLAMMKRDPELRGPELFDARCAACHTLGDHGDETKRTAPSLTGWSTEAWILAMLHEPDGDGRFGRTALKGEMPSMDVAPKDPVPGWKPMSAEDKSAAAAFLAKQGDGPGEAIPKGALRGDVARVVRGEAVVKARCTTCHLLNGEGDDGGQGLAPELAGYGSVAWVRTQIANPSSKATYRESALEVARKGHMPRFDSDLRPEDIDVLARWVHARTRGL